MNRPVTRRKFLQDSAAIAAGFCLAGPVAARGQSANNKLNIGVIGVANRAADNIRRVNTENIVAICDVDETFLARAGEEYPRAKRYKDFRVLLEQKDIDAVVISTPDHTHAFATVMALHSGRHVYCEKPLTHSVHEARVVATMTAANPKLATQMGIQIHAGANYRRVVELIQSGAIGPVRECHVWTGRSREGAAGEMQTQPVPRHLDWDLWVGPAPMRPYHSDYHPRNWRAWWNFGAGTLGDLGCHYMDLVHWALKLRIPNSIEAKGPPVHPEITPTSMMARYIYPAPDRNLVAGSTINVTWYDSGLKPGLVEEGTAPNWPNGILFVGAKGMLLADYVKHILLPEETFAGFEPPAPFIPDSIGHHQEWIRACKTGDPASCDFDYSTALTEAVLLGNVAYRTGRRLEWDAAAMRATNAPEADEFIRREHRAGWKI